MSIHEKDITSTYLQIGRIYLHPSATHEQYNNHS